MRRVIENVRERTREEWSAAVHRRAQLVRIWIQENPEKAALIAFCAGVLLPFTLRLVGVILLLLMICGALIWFLAPPAERVGPVTDLDVRVDVPPVMGASPRTDPTASEASVTEPVAGEGPIEGRPTAPLSTPPISDTVSTGATNRNVNGPGDSDHNS